MSKRTIVHVVGVRIRRTLAKRPWLYWIVVAGLAVSIGASVLERVDRIDRARSAWGETRRVLVATADIDPGQPIAAEWRSLPVAGVPPRAIRTEPDGVARQHVSAGEIVTEVDVADGEAPLALVPDDWLVVAVVESPGSGAEVGERVVVASEGVVLAGDALVVGHVDGATLTAVPAGTAPLLTLAAESAHLSLLRRP